MRLQRAEICAVAGRSLFRGDGGRARISAGVYSLGSPGLSTLAALLMLCYTQVSVRGSASPIRCGRCALPLDVTPRGMAAVQAPRIRLALALALLQVRCCLIAQSSAGAGCHCWRRQLVELGAICECSPTCSASALSARSG